MIDQLIRSIQEKNNATVVGLDPRLNFVPSHIKEQAYAQYGKTLKGASEALLQFNKTIIDHVHDLVPAVKPQVAMYEQYGVEGLQAYMDTIQYAKEKGLVIIGDIKRSDIASTAMAYSDGHIGRVTVEDECFEVYKEDFITLNPYLGYDSIEPYIGNCNTYDKGLFILVKTSNPNSGEIQDLLVEGDTIYKKVGQLVNQWGTEAMGELGYSRIGAVVGATHPKQSKELRKVMPKTFFLVPGYGAQGATAEDLAGCFNKDGLGAIVNSSRGIIAAYTKEQYKKTFKAEEFGSAARKAVIAMRNDLNRVR
ncbi:orotidine-5'-phosphate decarboxylase [Vallitalea pronyensis]|uniref:Orotidine 5'-phosphate decarboxylase n=1 Tax=Vallitalea pronyensis TaxID=1348613 RepID=A0A8J8MI31_9FIRM|nr:orotidine-5'-phosphate decarboxylase [Vallitalea pronyensis]QUI21936.1 orotidine-5'-phosphate decarboxylase [Vallitalea pronyensis]